MRVLACVFLFACGGGDSAVEGEPLIQSTLTGQFDNKAWTPMFGFGRMETTNFGFFIGSGEISCADDFDGKPREGSYFAVGVPAPVAMGSSTNPAQMVDVTGGEYMTQIVPGSLMVTGVTETEVSAVLAFDTTIDGGRFALNGAVTVLRCP